MLKNKDNLAWTLAIIGNLIYFLVPDEYRYIRLLGIIIFGIAALIKFLTRNDS